MIYRIEIGAIVLVGIEAGADRRAIAEEVRRAIVQRVAAEVLAPASGVERETVDAGSFPVTQHSRAELATGIATAVSRAIAGPVQP